MPTPRKSSLLIVASILLMAIACLLPSVNFDIPPSRASTPARGWQAAAWSFYGTFWGIDERDWLFALLCFLGLLANASFLLILLLFLCRRYLRARRPRHRTLAIVSALGSLSAIASLIWLLPGSLHTAAFAWLLSQLPLTSGLWLTSEPQTFRGFEVLAVPTAATK